MSVLQDVASGAMDMVQEQSPELVYAALNRGTALLAGVKDPTLKASLSSVLGVLSTPDAVETLAAFTNHEVVSFTAYVGLELAGDARIKFLGDPSTTFAQRHALLASDDAASRKDVDDHAALLSDLEALASSILRVGGAAAVPFLMAIL